MRITDVWMERNSVCNDCGCRAIKLNCNTLIEPYSSWDWWMYCSNPICRNHSGEGVAQFPPSWVGDQANGRSDAMGTRVYIVTAIDCRKSGSKVVEQYVYSNTKSAHAQFYKLEKIRGEGNVCIASKYIITDGVPV